MLAATNATGVPCLVLKAGFIERPTRKVTDEPLDLNSAEHRVCGDLPVERAVREDVLVTLGRALEKVLAVAEERPLLARTGK